MKHALIYIFFAIVFSGCSVRSKALSQDQSSSSEYQEVEETIASVDTSVNSVGDSVSVQVKIETQYRDTIIYVKGKNGSIKLTFKDSVLIAQAIWDSQKIPVTIPIKYKKVSKGNTIKTQSSESEEYKKSPFMLRIWPLWVALIVILLLFPYLKKLYKWLRFPM